MQNDNLLNHTRAFVDLDALSGNLKAIRQKIGNQIKIMAVLKANAYGHGAVEVARTIVQCGVSFLAVARISEAIALREQGIETPILLFGTINPDQAVYAASNNIRLSVSSLAFAKKLNDSLAREKVNAFVHIKIDTGMGRLGLFCDHSLDLKKESNMDSIVQEILDMKDLEYINLEGIYTHFACADEKDKTHTNKQLALFEQLLSYLKLKCIKLELVHAANSAAVIDIPCSYFNMVRPGLALYGMYPSFEVNRKNICLQPVMEIRSEIIHLKKVPKGTPISYGSTYTTKRATIVGTIPIGYGDGYSRLLSSKGRMLVRGYSAPIIGRVCMDMTMVDLTDIPGASEGDEVIILGIQGEEQITADEIADLTSTINYEVLASLKSRIPIVYTHGGKKE